MPGLTACLRCRGSHALKAKIATGTERSNATDCVLRIQVVIVVLERFRASVTRRGRKENFVRDEPSGEPGKRFRVNEMALQDPYQLP